MASRKAGEWGMRHFIDEIDLMLLVADSHQHGVAIICLHPNSDGSSKTAFKLRNVLQQIKCGH